MSRHSALLWLSLVLGAAAEPARCETALPPPVDAVRSQLRDGNVEAAIEAGEQAVETLVKDSQAWFWLGRAYAQQAMRVGMLSKPKWAGKTREAYEQAVALDPDHLDARFDLMQYYAMAPGFLGGGREKADAQAASLRQRDPMMGKLAEGMLANYDDEAEQAERAYRDALALAPQHPRPRIALAMQLQRDEPRWDEIERLWQEVLARAPEDRLAHYQLGRLAALRGNGLETGLEHLQTFLAGSGDDEYTSVAGAHWRRGQILEKLGRRDDALAAYREALRLQPSFEPAREDLERLEDA